MQFQLIPGFLIFVGSYLPLAIILAFQDIPYTWWSQSICNISQLSAGRCNFNAFEHPALSLSFLLTSATAVVLAWFALNRISYPFCVDVKRAKANPNEIINYTFPYVVSFMGITYADPQKFLGFGVFLLWMFAITYKSGQILMNPLLLILGWRLYDATIIINSVERDVQILKRGNLDLGIVQAQTIQSFYIIKG